MRRRRLAEEDFEDFRSAFFVHLIDNDYAILRNFRGQASLDTYLVSVAAKFEIDYFRSQWGRFRCSAKALGIGAEAEELEILVYRDGFGLEEAIEALTSYNPKWSRRHLLGVWEQLPPRAKATEVSEDGAAAVAAVETAEATVELLDAQRMAQELEEHLRVAFAQLPDRARVMIALKFEGRRPVTEIASTVALSVATTHRHIDLALRQLAASLQESGVKRSDLRLLGHTSVTLSPLLQRELESFFRPVRLLKRDG